MLYLLHRHLLLLLLTLGLASSGWTQITFISTFTGNQGGATPLFGEDAPIGGNMFVDWETFGSATTGAGQGSDCRVIIRGMTPNSDAQSLIASDVVCTLAGTYNGENGNNDLFFANLNACNLPAGRYSIEIQCDELGGDYDNSTGGATAATTWNYWPPESPTYYYGGTAGACGASDGLENITEVGEGGVAGTPQLEYFNVGDADVYRTMVVLNGLFMDMGKFQPGNPTLPASLGDLQTLYDPACVGVGTFPTAGFCGDETLMLDGAEVNVTKSTDCGNADVTGNRLFYRVYPTGGTPSAYASFAIPFMDDCPNGYPGAGNAFPTGGSCQNLNNILDQRWQTTSAGVDLLALASTAGTYTVDFYTETDVVDCSGTASTVTEGTYTTSFTMLSDFGTSCPINTCACPTCPTPPATTAVMVSSCPVEDGTYGTQMDQDNAADGTAANPFATWNGALTFAQMNGIDHIVFAPGTYMTDGSVFNAFSLANGGHPVTLAGMYVDGGGSTIINTSTGPAGFANIGADNVTIVNINLVDFSQAVTIEDDQGFTMCNSIIDGSDIDGLNGAFINSDTRNTDATFIGVQFNNHDTPNFTSAMDIFASSVTEAINTTVNFCDVDWNCNERDGFGGALFIGHGGARGNPAWAGPIVCMEDGGFYGNVGLGIASDGGALNVQDNSTLTIDGTEFVCNISNADDGTSGGGAIRIQGGAAVTISNANFTGNSTTQYGGAILYTVANGADPALNISNTVFWNNTANRGGGLYSGSETTTNVTDSYFEGNVANGTAFSNGGGAIYVDAGVQGTSTPTPTDFNLTNSTLTGNTSADDEAGGMHIYEASTTEDDDDVTEDDHIFITNSVLCDNTSNDANQADLSEDAFSGFLNEGFSSITIDAASVIGAGMADNGVDVVADRDLSQGDCAAIPAGVGFQGAPPAALVCPACPATPSTTSLCCGADAGNIVRPPGGTVDVTTGNQTICIGDDLGPFTNNYTATDETDPGAVGFETTFILTDASGNIIQVATNGDFDFSTLPVGTYDIYVLNYSTGNIPNNIADYLMGLSSGMADGIGSNVSEIIADEDDTSSGGTGMGTFCLDLDNLDDDGLDADSDAVQVTIVPLPMIDATATTPFLVCDLDQPNASYDVVTDFGVTTTPAGGTLVISGTNTTGMGTFDLSAANPGDVLGMFTLTYTDLNGCMTTLDVTYEASNDAGCDPLPVELIDFTATLVDNSTVLAWTTATEINTSHFDVERSFDGAKFETLAKVNAAGTSNEAMDYTFTDNAPKTGANYYRLKQVDLDGTFTYTAVRIVNLNSDKVQVEIYPNPVAEDLQFRISANAAVNTPSVAIYDMFGREVLTLTPDFDVQQQTGTISTTELSAGVYFLLVRSGATTLSLERFVKQ